MPPPAHLDLPPSTAATRLESIIGGTLALLTHYARMPNLAAADRIACNLALIATASRGLGRLAGGVHGAVHRLARPAGGAGCAAGQRVARRLADAAGDAVAGRGARG